MKKQETLQDKLQTEQRKENRMGRLFTVGAVIVTLLACLGMGWQKLVDWSNAGLVEAEATAAVVETRQANETATAVANAPTPGYADPAEIVKLSLEQWYNWDYTGEFEDWAEKMCEFTTKYACQDEVYNIGGENWKNNVVPGKYVSVVEVTPVKAVWEHSYYDDKAGRNVDAQVWEYKLVGTLHPGKEFIRYVMVANEGAGWLMVHNLWDNEAEQLLQEIRAKATPNA